MTDCGSSLGSRENLNQQRSLTGSLDNFCQAIDKLDIEFVRGSVSKFKEDCDAAKGDLGAMSDSIYDSFARTVITIAAVKPKPSRTSKISKISKTSKSDIEPLRAQLYFALSDFTKESFEQYLPSNTEQQLESLQSKVKAAKQVSQMPWSSYLSGGQWQSHDKVVAKALRDASRLGKHGFVTASNRSELRGNFAYDQLRSDLASATDSIGKIKAHIISGPTVEVFLNHQATNLTEAVELAIKIDKARVVTDFNSRVNTKVASILGREA